MLGLHLLSHFQQQSFILLLFLSGGRLLFNIGEFFFRFLPQLVCPLLPGHHIIQCLGLGG
jgi:hypothetical protein